MHLELIMVAIVVLGLSGLPVLLPARLWPRGACLAAGLMLVGSVLGLTAVGLALGARTMVTWQADWGLPVGRFAVALDALSAVFLLPVFVVPALGAWYGLSYWRPAAPPAQGRRLALSYGLLTGAMALVCIARDGVLFLIAWELMALAAFFAATVKTDDPAVRRSGWIYLVATHLGTLCLIAMFGLWQQVAGSLALEPLPSGVPEPLAGALFVLALVGFGCKAGLMPLHVWLPGAHANAPSHVSAVMSGVMLNMGVYGLVRMTALLPDPAAWWGGALLGVGSLSGVLGMAYALGQRDIKRLLAYSSIENMGIVALGLGLALLGRAQSRADWVVLGLGGALLHVWNHSLFKSLLFLNAGAIIHATGTRAWDRLGGLGRHMPHLMALMALGAVAICGLPPLNGFVGEWLLYAGFLRSLGVGADGGHAALALGAVVLSFIGALSLACFVNLLATVFLGSARGAGEAPRGDPPLNMRLPMFVLAAACVTIGLAPVHPLAPLEAAITLWAQALAPLPSVCALVPLPALGLRGLLLLGLGAVFAGGLVCRLRRRPAAVTGTWDCGYAQPTARMQYTGSSLTEPLTTLVAPVLRPRLQRPVLQGLFPRATRFRNRLPDAVLDRVLLPLVQAAARLCIRVRVLQQGNIQWYLLYILITMLVLLIGGGREVP